ncbi:alanine dehydrogenase [Clostridium sp.]|uniref:alanine dehydrogenase n=1 Tax=Clostridium sp. TaxID=1506 RepID=UPI003F2FDD2D
MIIGALKEIKPGESRVIVTPVEVEELVSDGHEVLVQAGAGYIAGFYDEEYINAGAKIIETREEVYEKSEMILKVKEFFEEEYNLLKKDQILFACIHPASNREEVDALLEKEVIAFTAEDSHRYGSPNCEVAGKLGALMGVNYLLNSNGGSGKLIAGIGGAPGANVIVLGAGIVGKGAIQILSSLGAQVTVMDVNIGTMRDCQDIYPANVRTMFSNKANIKALLPTTDLVVNCVKWPKHRTDHLITKDMLNLMRKGSVIVDISADVGGAIETYRPTTHEDPIYEVNGVIHYGVDNIPGAAAHTTSIAYAASVLPHIRSIANNGVKNACERDGYLRRSMTAYKGILTHEETSVIQSREWTSPETILNLDINKIDVAPKATTTVAK